VSAEETKAHSFPEIWHDELDALTDLRQRRRVEDPIPPREGAGAKDSPEERAYASNLFGLAISGGGIRSATFGLGVVQGLAKVGLLRRFDFLSTSSGGGYMGSWLVSWIKRAGLDTVEDRLPQEVLHRAEGNDRVPQGREESPVTFLRRFSNYLTPQVGAFSADTWTVVATYVRNLLLNLLVLVAALAAVLLAPRAIVIASTFFEGHPDRAFYAALAFLGVSIAGLGLNTFREPKPAEMLPGTKAAPGAAATSQCQYPWYMTQGWVQIGVVVPLFLVGWLSGIALWYSKGLEHLRGRIIPWDIPEVAKWAIAGAILYTGAWAIAGLFRLVLTRGKAHQKGLWQALIFSAPLAGAVGTSLIWGLIQLYRKIHGRHEGITGEVSDWSLIHITTWATPLIMLVFIVTAVVQIGLMGRAFREADRQWWSRLGAWMLIYSITWLALFVMTFYGPLLLIWLGAIVAAGLGAGWLASTAGGVLVGKTASKETEKPSLVKGLVKALAPQIFIIGLLAVLAFGLHALLGGTGTTTPGGGALPAVCQDFWPEKAPETDSAGTDPAAADTATVPTTTTAHGDGDGDTAGNQLSTLVACHSARDWASIVIPNDGRNWQTIFLMVGLLAFALVLSWRVDINQFSMHLFYRSRLVRAYLGASNKNRTPQPFSGFDPDDDLPLAQMSPQGTGEPGERPYDGPLPILNTTLNLVKGEELAWQERKGASFIFTPLYSGFDAQLESGGTARGALEANGYRPTREYDTHREGVSIGTAMGISGAAASPNMGKGTTSALAFLLTVFNVRLGWWLGNPRHSRSWCRLGPDIGLLRLLDELFSRTNSRSRYVYLSDGGHFENTGLYELLRRRTRVIVLSDGGADGKRTFNDLGNAVHKARTDFGIEIEIDPELLRLTGEGQRSKYHWTLGRIRYSDVDENAPDGLLIYLKSSLTGDEPADVFNYAADNETFPHQPTSDQFFSETQFESYRRLGFHVAGNAFGRIADQLGGSVEELTAALEGELTAYLKQGHGNLDPWARTLGGPAEEGAE